MLAFSRQPSPAEIETARTYLQSHPAASQDAFVDLCHVLLNSNEFLYVD
jgi:hypothetical protein